MKTLYLSITLSIILLVGCSVEEPQPTKPNNSTQGNGKGVLYGMAGLWGFVTNGNSLLYWDERNKSIKVEVIGTTIISETDGYGLYSLKGLDSGYYSLRFSKRGYDTVQIDSIFSNGKDSTKVYFVLKDSSGRTGVPAEIINLRELTPSISVSKASATTTETIRVDTLLDHGTIRKIRRDTSYSWQGEFSIDLKSDVKATQDSLDVGYYVAITNSSTVDKSLIPTEFSDSQTEIKKGWHSYFGSSKKTKAPYSSTRDFILTQSESNSSSEYPVSLSQFTGLSNYKISKTTQLYLHIIPVTKELKYKQESNRLSTWKLSIVGFKLGEIKTIPIEWR